jgi:hypothetical protein
MDGAGGNDRDEASELWCPLSRRLTLAPPPWEEVLVEDIADDDSSDLDDSYNKGELSALSLISAHYNRRMMKIGWLIQN